VSINAILALNEILEEEGGIAINRRMVIYLLNRINQYTEFGQNIIFDLVSRYEPHGEDEMLDILNILEERLKHSSSSVVLGCIKVFLSYTKDNQLMTRQVYTRIQSPLITLFTGAEVTGAYELAYCVLAHINLIISKGAGSVFENDFKSFFCKFDEPTYIKFMKISILTMISSENNVGDIINELSAYVTDVNADISRKSIQAASKIALKIPSTCVSIVRQLLSFLSLNIDYVITETLVAMKDLIRKYRQLSLEILIEIENSLEIASDDEGKAAIIWMIGEFGEDITDAPYIIEGILNNINTNDNIQITNALISATVKLFLKRAPEMKDILVSLYQKLKEECDNPDVMDRAGFYYNLLQYSPQVADEILNCEKHPILNFLEDDNAEIQDIGCQEFNLLSVIYQKPAKSILKPKPEFTVIEQIPEPASDLLSLDNLDVVESTFCIDQTPVVNSEEYQNYWNEIPDSLREDRRLSRYINIEEVEQIMAQAGIYCIASGDQGGVLKFYFYAKETETSALFLLEIVVTSASKDVSVLLKSQNNSFNQDFMKLVNRVTSNFLQT
jgi:AP-4 complex subunit beta-1